MTKDLLLGIGIALIITSSILMVTDSGSYKDDQLSHSKIIEKARKVGMLFPGEDINTRDELYLERQTTLESTRLSSKKPPLSSQIIIEIPTGISSREVADLLQENNLIKDKKSFIKLLTKFNLANKIMAGRYQFKTDISPLKLLLTLTAK